MNDEHGTRGVGRTRSISMRLSLTYAASALVRYPKCVCARAFDLSGSRHICDANMCFGRTTLSCQENERESHSTACRIHLVHCTLFDRICFALAYSAATVAAAAVCFAIRTCIRRTFSHSLTHTHRHSQASGRNQNEQQLSSKNS